MPTLLRRLAGLGVSPKLGAVDNDPAKALAAQALHSVLLGALPFSVLYLSVVIPLFVAKKAAASAILAVMLAVALVCMLLLRQGYIRLSSWIFLSTAWLILATFVALSGGITSPALLGHIAVIVAAAWMLGRSTAIWIGALSVGLGLSLAIMESGGVHLPRYFPVPPMVAWVILAALASFAILPLTSVNQALSDSVKQAQRELEVRRYQEQARAESDERFRATFHQAAVGIAHIGLDGKWLLLNDRFCQMLGYTMGELSEKTIQEISHPGDLGAILSGRRQLLAGEISSHTMEKRYLRKDQSIFWASLYRSLVRDQENRPKYFIAVIEDINERKQAEAALHDVRERYKEVFDSTADCILLIDVTSESRFKIAAMNPAAEAALGCSNERVSGAFIEDVVTDDVAKQLTASYRYSLKVGALVTEERELNLPVGFRHFQVSLIPVRNAAGRVHRLVELAHDITERKQAEAEVRASEKRFRQMADTAPVGIWMTGPEGMISFYNQHALRFVNRTLEQLIGTAGMEFIHPDDRGDVQGAFTSALAEHGHFEVTCRVQGSEGEYRWVLCGGVPRFEIENKFCGYIGSFIDVTDLRRAHDQSLARQKMESLGVLASGIAHDFNNLLGGILASTEVALGERAAAAVVEELIRIKTACIVAAKIVRQLMIYGGAEGSDRQPVDISSLVNEMLPLLKVVVSKHAILEVEFDENLPFVQANSAQIEQVVMNLITNASEAIGERDGVIRVTTSTVRVNPVSQMPSGTTLPDGDYVQLAVYDTGSGMTPEVQARVFDPFFSTKFNGRGLGLAVVQGIVRSHVGAIHVRSTIGKGSVFQVVLPSAPSTLQSPHRSATREQEDRRAPVTTVAPEQIARRTGTILLVEDEPVLRGAVAKFLRKSGFSVLEALDGFEAMELLRSHADSLDAVLLDVTLPGVPSRDVFEYAQRLQPRLKIILTSAYDGETVRTSFTGLNATHFIRKPFQLSDLVRVL